MRHNCNNDRAECSLRVKLSVNDTVKWLMFQLVSAELTVEHTLLTV